MRLNGAVAAGIYSSALLFGRTWADDADEAESSSTIIEEVTTSSAIEKPTFTVST